MFLTGDVRDVPRHRRARRPVRTHGPDLTHLASRRTIAAGTLPNTRGNLAGWIVDPQRIKPGAHMPPNMLEPKDLDALLDLSPEPQVSEQIVTSPTRRPHHAPGLADEAELSELAVTWRRAPGFWGWLTSVDHKSIGKRYIATAFILFILAGIERGADAHAALAARERASSGPTATTSSSPCTARR